MQYKTIILELLQQRTEMCEQLRKERKLLSAMTLLATELRTLHRAWEETLSKAHPGVNHRLISSQALELAVREFVEDHLPPASGANEETAFSLDEVMAYIHKASPKE